MLQTIKKWFNRARTAMYPLSSVPPGFFLQQPERNFGYRPAVVNGEQAITLSPFYAALRHYQQSTSVLPLVTYQKDANGGRNKFDDKPVFDLLHDRPNPAQSSATFFEKLIHDYFVYGEFFVRINWSLNHRLLGLYPIHPRDIKEVKLLDDWTKEFYFNDKDFNEGEPLKDNEVIHVVRYSPDGLRGMPFLHYAATSLGLHSQIAETANAIYRNSARISAQVVTTAALTREVKDEWKAKLDGDFTGSMNAGKVPFMPLGLEFKPIDTRSAEASLLIDALNLGVAEVGRWFDNLSPLLLGDLSRGTYSNSAAEKLGFYQKNLLPILNKIQQEFNHKLFTGETYCEFLTDNILRADPLTQSQVWHNGLMDGYYLKSEIRAWLNLPPVEGMDVPTAPLNMGPTEPAEQEITPVEGENVETQTTAE
jgi:HK97 family phage portal protein